MKIRVIYIWLFWTLTFNLHGQNTNHIQESRYKSFRVLIISPDTAIIHDSLKFYVSQIETEFKNSFYESLREHQNILNTGSDEERLKSESVLREARWHETDIARFKYFHQISIEVFVSLHEYFKKYPWEDKMSLDCEIVNRNDLETDDLSQLAEEGNFDYIIYFNDIIADKYADGFIMDLTTYLFSKTDSKNIMKKKTWKEGAKWYCDMYELNLLECLMSRVVDDAISELCYALSERQRK